MSCRKPLEIKHLELKVLKIGGAAKASLKTGSGQAFYSPQNIDSA
jgi:hypothetical protein